MKRLLAITILGAAFSASATTFSDSEVVITLITDTPAVKNGNYVTFAAESTFLVPADAKLPAGTKMKLIWTVDCSKKFQRIVLASITVPGQPAFIIAREEMLANAKREAFTAPKDEVSKQVIASVCR